MSPGKKLTAEEQSCYTDRHKQQCTYWGLYFNRWRFSCSYLPSYVIKNRLCNILFNIFGTFRSLRILNLF